MPGRNGTETLADLDWDVLDTNDKLIDHVWKVLRQRVLEWEERGAYWTDRAQELQAGIDFDPFRDEADAFFLFKMWEDCVQLYRLNPDDWLVTITCSTQTVPGSVGQRAPTVARAMFRSTVAYLHKKRIKWRPGV